MRESHVPTQLDQVSRAFAALGLEHGLRVLYAAADKHGSWEWAAVAEERPDVGINRFISLALTECEPEPSAFAKYLVEFWAEAEVDEDQRRGKRTKVHHFVISQEAIPTPGLAETLQGGLRKAWERASSFRAQEMVAL